MIKEYRGNTEDTSHNEDIDDSDEESDSDPFQEFQAETQELFNNCLQAQIQMKRSHEEFIKMLIMEIKSLKLTYNVQNEFVAETVFIIVLKTLDSVHTENAQQLANKI